MNANLVPISSRKLAGAGFNSLPVIITNAGERASWRFFEFFTANIRNPNTRAAYARAVADFFGWCERHGVAPLPAI